MKAQRQFAEMKSVMKTMSRMIEQPTTDKLSAYMGAATKEVELSRHLSFAQRSTLKRLITELCKELREDVIDTDAVIDARPAPGFLELLFDL